MHCKNILVYKRITVDEKLLLGKSRFLCNKLCLMNHVKQTMVIKKIMQFAFLSQSICLSVLKSTCLSVCLLVECEMCMELTSKWIIILISFCSRQLCTGYAFATTGAVAVALGLNHLTKARFMCTCIYEQYWWQYWLLLLISHDIWFNSCCDIIFIVLFSQSAPPLIGRYVPFAAVAAANCVNIPLMRQT